MGRTTRQSRDRIQAGIEQRRGQVALMLRGGHKGIREIAAKLNVAPSTISEDVRALRIEWAKRRKMADQEFDLDVERLDELLRGIYLPAKQGSLPAVDRVLAVIDRRGRMFQYDQQAKPVKSEVEMTLEDRREAPEELTDAELEEIARKALQARKPHKATAVRKKKAGGKTAG